MKLSERQDRPLEKQGEGSVKTLDDVELPEWVQQVLALGPKHPVNINLMRHTFSPILTSFYRISKIVKSLGRPFVRSKLWQKPMLKG